MESLQLERAADEFTDWLFDTEGRAKEQAAAMALPPPANLSESSRQFLEWLQRQGAAQFHRQLQLQAEGEWLAAQTRPFRALPDSGTAVPEAGTKRRRRRGRGGRPHPSASE